MYDIYDVVAGDTLDSIAFRFNTTKEELYKLNGYRTDNINSNSKIIVPSINKDIYNYYKVKNGDTISSIASNNNVDVNTLLLLNGLNANDYIYPNQIIMIPRDNVLFYLTKNNDTLFGVSNKLGVDINKIVNDNDNIYLREGQFIVVIN